MVADVCCGSGMCRLRATSMAATPQRTAGLFPGLLARSREESAQAESDQMDRGAGRTSHPAPLLCRSCHSPSFIFSGSAFVSSPTLSQAQTDYRDPEQQTARGRSHHKYRRHRMVHGEYWRKKLHCVGRFFPSRHTHPAPSNPPLEQICQGWGGGLPALLLLGRGLRNPPPAASRSLKHPRYPCHLPGRRHRQTTHCPIGQNGVFTHRPWLAVLQQSGNGHDGFRNPTASAGLPATGSPAVCARCQPSGPSPMPAGLRGGCCHPVVGRAGGGTCTGSDPRASLPPWVELRNQELARSYGDQQSDGNECSSSKRRHRLASMGSYWGPIGGSYS